MEDPKMQKQFPTVGSTALLFGLTGPKRKSLKRNSKGLEDFRQYFSDNDSPSSDSNDESLSDTSTDTVPADQVYHDSINKASYESRISLEMCSPKQLSFNDGPVSEGEESRCHGDSAIEEKTAHNLSDTIVEASTILKCKRKRRKRIVPPKKQHKTLPKHTESSEVKTTKELIDVGGVRYERIPIPERSTVTPGVRRSRRKRVGTLDQRDMLQYQDHWGVTPSHRVGREVNCVLKPVAQDVVTENKKAKPARPSNNNECLRVTDPVTGNEMSQRIVQSTSNITPTNVKGEQLSPEDDVLYHTFISSPSFKCGSLYFKRYSEKLTARTGDNSFVFHVVKGRVNVLVNEQQFGPLSNGHWIHVPPNTSYSITNDTKGAAEMLFYIDKSHNIESAK